MNQISDKTEVLRTDRSEQARTTSEKDDLNNDAVHGGKSGRTIRIAVVAFCALAWVGIAYYALA